MEVDDETKSDETHQADGDQAGDDSRNVVRGILMTKDGRTDDAADLWRGGGQELAFH